MCAGRSGRFGPDAGPRLLTAASLSGRPLPRHRVANDNASVAAMTAKRVILLAGTAVASTAALFLTVLSL